MDLSKLSLEFVADVQHLQDLREEIAGQNRALNERELEARVLRADIEDRLRAGVKDAEGAWVVTPIGKSDVEKTAKLDAGYLDFDRATIRLAYDRDLALAEAEVTRLQIQAVIALYQVAA
jgi:hypothetical protein